MDGHAEMRQRKKEAIERREIVISKILQIFEAEMISVKESKLILEQCDDRVQALTKVKISEL